jgi:hypothetical protein
MKEKLPLDKQDIKKLRKNLLGIILFPFVGIGIIYAFFSIFFNLTDFTQSLKLDGNMLYIFIGMSVLFGAVIAWMIWGFVIDLRSGFKYRIEGRITDKRLDIHTSTTHSSNTKTGSSSISSSTSRHYSVSIDGVEYSIEGEHYGKLKVGASITMEKAPKSNVTLLLELGNADKVLPVEAVNDKRKFLRSTPGKVPFDPDDFEALKKGFKAQIKRRLIWFLPTIFIAWSFILNDMSAFLIFLFPIVIIPGYQLWKFSRELKQYNRNKQYAFKQGLPAIVEDKSKYSHNGKGSYNVKTTQGHIKVNEQVYEKLNPGDKIILFKPAAGTQILSVMAATNEEFYLM